MLKKKKIKSGKNIRRKVILPTMLALSILVVGILATNVTAANSNYPPIVTKIAQKFNLNISDVQEVFDDERDERRAEMFARFSERLDELVSSGEITSSQKGAILDKHEEMQNKMDELRNLSPEERRDKMQSIHEEFRSWLKDQGFENLAIGPFGHGFKRGFGMGHMMGESQ